jgi:hypothetical protein
MRMTIQCIFLPPLMYSRLIATFKSRNMWCFLQEDIVFVIKYLNCPYAEFVKHKEMSSLKIIIFRYSTAWHLLAVYVTVRI